MISNDVSNCVITWIWKTKMRIDCKKVSRLKCIFYVSISRLECALNKPTAQLVNKSSQLIVHGIPCLRFQSSIAYLHKRDNLFVRFLNDLTTVLIGLGGIEWPPKFLHGMIWNLIKNNHIINHCAENLFRLCVGKTLPNDEQQPVKIQYLEIWNFTFLPINFDLLNSVFDYLLCGFLDRKGLGSKVDRQMKSWDNLRLKSKLCQNNSNCIRITDGSWTPSRNKIFPLLSWLNKSKHFTQLRKEAMLSIQ